MNIAVRVLKASSPVSAWRASPSSTTKPADPLSYMPATFEVTETVPSGGISPCKRIPCSPWTSIAMSNSPMERMAAPPCPTIVAKVGSTRCVDALRVLRCQVQLETRRIETARSDTQGVEQRVLMGPGPFDRF